MFLVLHMSPLRAIRSGAFSRAVELLDKWSGLELLLRWSAVASDAFFDDILARALSRWTQSELRRFTRLPENAKNKIQDALIAASLRHTDYRWQSIEISLKHG